MTIAPAVILPVSTTLAVADLREVSKVEGRDFFPLQRLELRVRTLQIAVLQSIWGFCSSER